MIIIETLLGKSLPEYIFVSWVTFCPMIKLVSRTNKLVTEITKIHFASLGKWKKKCSSLYRVFLSFVVGAFDVTETKNEECFYVVWTTYTTNLLDCEIIRSFQFSASGSVHPFIEPVPDFSCLSIRRSETRVAGSWRRACRVCR